MSVLPAHINSDEYFMALAIELAKKGLGRTYPNPAVGCVVVKSNKIISKGWHKKAGLNHAEIEALKGLTKKDLKSAKLFVTLEPCSHFGKTPPCVNAMIESGIKKVIVGCLDPNPQVKGKGVKRLRQAGIEVTTGVLKKECLKVIESFEKFVLTKIPFVNIKLASTLDGKIALSNGTSKWITCEASRKRVHLMRASHDAILTGLHTVLNDNPSLTVRHIKGKNPVRVVLDDKFKIPLTANIFKGIKDVKDDLIIFVKEGVKSSAISEYEKKGATVIAVPYTKDGLKLKSVLKELGSRNITNLMVESGSKVAGSFFKEGLVDRVSLFLAPKFIGAEGLSSIGELKIKDLKDVNSLKDIETEFIGDDIFITGLL